MTAVSLAEVKAFLQIDHDQEDLTIDGLIDAAVMHTEDYTGLSLSVHTGVFNPELPPLEPYTLAEQPDKTFIYTTSITPRLPALKPALFMYIKAMWETDPKTIKEAMDAFERLADLQRLQWGF